MIKITVGQNINLSVKRANDVLSGLTGKMKNGSGAHHAVYAALKRAADSAKTKAGRFAAEEYTIKKSTFMHNVTSKTVSENDTSGNVINMSILFAGYNLPLISYKTRVGKDGRVQTQVIRNGGEKTLQHAFVAALIADQKNVLERTGASRIPTAELYGPSTAQMMQNEAVKKQMEDTIIETYEKRIDHEITRVLNGWGR